MLYNYRAMSVFVSITILKSRFTRFVSIIIELSNMQVPTSTEQTTNNKQVAHCTMALPLCGKFNPATVNIGSIPYSSQKMNSH
jgi:hypothetical protein